MKLVLNARIVEGEDALFTPKDGKNSFNDPLIYEINQQRSAAETIEINCKEEDVIELEFEDGTEWIVSAEDISEVFGQGSKRGSSDKFILPNALSDPNSRGIGSVALKFVKIFVRKKAEKFVSDLSKNLGKLFDKRMVADEGLFQVSPSFELEKFEKPKTKQHYLLFIHGFGSNIQGAFSDLASEENTIVWNSLKSRYHQSILAFNHWTVTKSPIVNTIDLLNEIPDNCSLDVISHSRGGLIADLLARCSQSKSPAFSKADIDLLKTRKNDKNLADNSLSKDLEKLNSLAAQKNIKVERIIRVACPSRGTILLSRRLDHFLNAVLQGLGYIAGGKLNVPYQITKDFLKGVLQDRNNIDVYPGLHAMVPDSSFQKMLNSKETATNDQLFVIAGNSEIGGGFKQSFLVILTNLFYMRANDFVVNTDSMAFGALRKDGANIYVAVDSQTSHSAYFRHLDSLKALQEAIMWDGQSDLDSFTKLNKQELIAFDAKDDSRKLAIEHSQKRGAKAVDLVDELFGKPLSSIKYEYGKLEISLSWGDLRFADAPVMVGHFAEDGIVSAEKALDRALDHKLSQRHQLGVYPKTTSDHVFVFSPESKPKGALIIGLGENIDFSEQHLKDAVENGVIEYVSYVRDNPKKFKGFNGKLKLTSLLIGSGFASLSMDTALTAILFGISKANQKLDLLKKSQGNNSSPIEQITQVEFLELFEHKALEAFYTLKEIGESNLTLNITPPNSIEKKFGRKKKIEYYRDKTWWHNLIAESVESSDDIKNSQIRFISSSGRAKVDDTVGFYAKKIVDKLILDYSKERRFNAELSNSLFQLLVPSKLKNVIRDQSNILWKMDPKTAEYPWEMIHDIDQDKEPTFVNSGLIRQLLTKQNDSLEKVARDRSALIIGDPLYENFSQLPYAKQEAEALADTLKSDGDWNVNLLTNKRSVELLTALLSTKYKILHIAGHGVYDPQNGEAGIVMGDSIVDSVFFSKLPHIPEFAFINCCYSGDIDSQFEKLHRERYKLAASIGVQLIEMGVQAVVITGWAVDDNAASLFAEDLYGHLLDGEFFGKAVLKSRKNNYHSYPNSKTWGAYQCYGDPWYRLVRQSSKKEDSKSYVTESEIVADLHNLMTSTINTSYKNWILRETEKVFAWASESNLATPTVHEKVAEIYAELDEIDSALEHYKTMLGMDGAGYSVRGLEQYCNLMVKQAMRAYENGNRILSKDKSLMLENFNYLLKIAETSERYILLGSAYKRFYFISNARSATKYLNSMVESYQKAYALTLELAPQEQSYPLTNFLLGQFFQDGIKGFHNGEKFVPMRDLLEEIKRKLAEAPTNHNNFWHDIALVNVATVDMLFANSISKVKTHSKRILAIYMDQFYGGGTPKALRSEIEQFKILKLMLDRQEPNSPKAKGLHRAHVNAVDKILSELQELN